MTTGKSSLSYPSSTKTPVIKLKNFHDLIPVDTFTKELPCDPLTPFGPPIPSWAATQSPHLLNDTNANLNSTSSHSHGLSSDAAVRASRRVCNSCFTYLYPEPLPSPTLIIHSPAAFALLSLNQPPAADSKEQIAKRTLLAESLCGNRIPKAFRPWTHNYGGHQFGYYAGQLGDGRCVSLCEVEIEGEGLKKINGIGKRMEIQVKGCGRTPYSRFGDGYAILRSSLREFLASEMLAALGIPTTRALAMVGSTREVTRENTLESGAVVVRMAESWVRFGSFEVFWYRSEKDKIKTLADYVINYHYPEVNIPKQNKIVIMKHLNLDSTSGNVVENRPVEVEVNKYAVFFKEVVKKTGILIAYWQAYGFTHGVLNTDNMSIIGLTLDFGPFGFLDNYDPYWTPNNSDSEKRYSFEDQPKIALWNLSKFGRTLVDLIESTPSRSEKKKNIRGEVIINEILKEFEPAFVEKYSDLMRK
ncbi:hypothetical protein HK096_006232, partial [Nowakowskiella sp. JEL0078]